MQRGEPEKVTGTKRKRTEESYETSQAEPEHETKEERRRRLNRGSARRSRKEKKEHIEFLESTVAQQKTVIRQLTSTLSDQQETILLLTARLAALTGINPPLPHQLEAPTLPSPKPTSSPDTTYGYHSPTLFPPPSVPASPQPSVMPFEPVDMGTEPLIDLFEYHPFVL